MKHKQINSIAKLYSCVWKSIFSTLFGVIYEFPFFFLNFPMEAPSTFQSKSVYSILQTLIKRSVTDCTIYNQRFIKLFSRILYRMIPAVAGFDSPQYSINQSHQPGTK